MSSGGCHCGAVRYEVSGAPEYHGLCHCADCRRCAGAPMVGWALFSQANLAVTRGTPHIYASSENGRRHFCEACGTGLFYTNDALFPDMIDIQSATLDDPESLGPPSMQIQVAERLDWVAGIHTLPEFARYPGM